MSRLYTYIRNENVDDDWWLNHVIPLRGHKARRRDSISSFYLLSAETSWCSLLKMNKIFVTISKNDNPICTIKNQTPPTIGTMSRPKSGIITYLGTPVPCNGTCYGLLIWKTQMTNKIKINYWHFVLFK